MCVDDEERIVIEVSLAVLEAKKAILMYRKKCVPNYLNQNHRKSIYRSMERTNQLLLKPDDENSNTRLKVVFVGGGGGGGDSNFVHDLCIF